MFSQITISKPKRRYTKHRNLDANHRRNYTLSYFLKIDGKNIKVCKTEFLAVHGLQNSRGITISYIEQAVKRSKIIIY